MSNYKEIQVVKIGSQALFRDDKKLDFNRIDDLCISLKYLRDERNIMTVLITSGAVALGKELADLTHIDDLVARDQMYATLGQPELIRLYSLHLGENVSQLLPTHSILKNKDRQGPIKNMIMNLLDAGIFPIINYNDSVDDNEMTQVSTYSDNDKVAEEIAILVGAERLILLTTVDGVMDSDNNLIEGIKGEYKEVASDFRKLEKYCNGKSGKGKGGMISKISTAEELYQKGICTIIGNAKYHVHHLLAGNDENNNKTPRTIFTP